jgi:hypothetical protein
MADNIFLTQDENQLVHMESQPYDSETLLAKFPDLLAGGQIDSAAPRHGYLSSSTTATAPPGRRGWPAPDFVLRTSGPCTSARRSRGETP